MLRDHRQPWLNLAEPCMQIIIPWHRGAATITPFKLRPKVFPEWILYSFVRNISLRKTELFPLIHADVTTHRKKKRQHFLGMLIRVAAVEPATGDTRLVVIA